MPVLGVYNCIMGLARETLECDCIYVICWHLLFGKALVDPQTVPLGTPCVSSSSKQSQHCPSANTGVSFLVAPPGHFSFSWPVRAFIPGMFPPHVLSILQPQALHCPLCPCIPSSCLTSPSLLLPPSADLCLFFMLFSAPELIFSLVCSSFPAFQSTPFSVLPGHNEENEGNEKIIKKKDKNPFLPLFYETAHLEFPKACQVWANWSIGLTC